MNEELFEIDDDAVGSVLLNAFSLTHGDRNNQYGSFVEDYQRVANVWNALCDGEPPVMCPEYALLFMVCMKLCRVAYGLHTGLAFESPAMVEDSITDCAGYLDGLWKSLNTPDQVDETDDDDVEPDDIDDWDDDDDDCD
jgi:hypothetical protein